MIDDVITKDIAAESVKSLEINIAYYNGMIGRGVRNEDMYVEKIKHTHTAIRILKAYIATVI